jgi:hypothetical protein
MFLKTDSIPWSYPVSLLGLVWFWMVAYSSKRTINTSAHIFFPVHGHFATYTTSTGSILFYIQFQFVHRHFIKHLLLMNSVFWDVTPCGYCKNRRFGGT